MKSRRTRTKAVAVLALLGCMLALGPNPAQANSDRYPFGISPGGRALVAHLREIPNLGVS
jgi:hypothetical protein